MAKVAFSKIHIPEFQSIKFPERLVRIDWISDQVRAQQRSDRRAAFEIVVLTSTLRGSSVDDDRCFDVDPSIEQQAIWISVDVLPVIWAGSVWHHGRRLAHHGFPKCARVTLTLGGTNTSFIQLQDKVPAPWSRDSQIAAVPVAAHTITRNGNWASVKSQRLLACACRSRGHAFSGSIADEFAVLIPAIELARFFGCANSLLARQLFAGQWRSLEEPKRSSTEIVDRQVTIGQAQLKGLDWNSAFYQAMYKFMPEMQSWVDLFGQVLTHRQTDQRPGFRFGFPIDLRSSLVTLTCEAVPLRHSGSGIPTRYLVTRMILCDFPLPFDRVFTSPHIHPMQVEGQDDDDLVPMAIPSGRVEEDLLGDRDDDMRLADAKKPRGFSATPDVPNRRPDTAFAEDDEVRIPILSAHPVELCSKPKQKNKHVKVTPQSGAPAPDTVSANPPRGETGAFAEGQVTSTSRPGGDTTAEDDDKDDKEPSIPTLELFLETLKKLRTDIDADKAGRLKSVTTTIEGSHSQIPYRGEMVYRIARPKAKRLKAVSRHFLLAELLFDDGRKFLVGELERRLLSDNFAVFCCESKFADTKSRAEFIDTLCSTIRQRDWLPKWISDTKHYEIGGSLVPGRRLTHAIGSEPGQISPSQYATRLSGMVPVSKPKTTTTLGEAATRSSSVKLNC